MAKQVYTRDNTNYGLNSIVSAIQNNINTRNARLDKTFDSVKGHATNMLKTVENEYDKAQRRKEFDDSDLREQLVDLRSNRDEAMRQLEELRRKKIFDKNKRNAFEGTEKGHNVENDTLRNTAMVDKMLDKIIIDGQEYSFSDMEGNDGIYI